MKQHERRCYGQHCAVARALDYVGERWTLLMVRELLIGPKRFKDLLEGLPGIGTNLLADRLKELEAAGILSRHELPPPAGSTVYELTELGQGLEATVFALGRWGQAFVRKHIPGEVSRPEWFVLALRASFRPEKAAGVRAQYELQLDGAVFSVEIEDAKALVAEGPATRPNMSLTTSFKVLVAMLSGELTYAEALRSGKACVDGSKRELRRFVELFAWDAPPEILPAASSHRAPSAKSHR